jgi:hypothetical protein
MTSADAWRRRATRLLATVGAATGVALLTRPQEIVDRISPAFPADRMWLARVLGVRLLVQHAAVLAAPGRRLVRFSSAVSLIHAASMVPFVASRRYGPAARASGALAAGYAAIALAVAPRSERG